MMLYTVSCAYLPTVSLQWNVFYPFSNQSQCFFNVGQFFFSFFFKIFLFLERGEGREKERERNISVWEKHQLVASCTPQPGTWPTTQASALTGNQSGDLSVCRTSPNPLSSASQGRFFICSRFKSFIREWFANISSQSSCLFILVTGSLPCSSITVLIMTRSKLSFFFLLWMMLLV